MYIIHSCCSRTICTLYMRIDSFFHTNPPASAPVYYHSSKFPRLVTILSKRCLEKLKSARVVAVQAKKRRRWKVNLVTDQAQLKIDNNKLSTTDKSDTECESRTWFWNKSVIEDDSDTEERGEEEDKESDSDIDEVRTQIKWNKEGEEKLRRVYRNSSRSTSRREWKSARELEKQASKTYDIRVLWQRNIELGMASTVNSQVGLEQVAES